MNAVKFNYEEHAGIVAKWPEKHFFPLPPREFLPEIGFVVENAACGFLYTTNSQLAWVEWIFSNPEKPKEVRTESLDVLFKLLEITARELGFKVLFSASGFDAYSQVLERNGFSKTDLNMVHFVKLLGGS